MKLIGPMKFEVWSGRGHERRKVETMSRRQAEAEYERLCREASATPAIFVGNLCVKGER